MSFNICHLGKAAISKHTKVILKIHNFNTVRDVKIQFGQDFSLLSPLILGIIPISV